MALTDDFNRSDGWIGAGWEVRLRDSWRIVTNTARPAGDFQETVMARSEKVFPSNHSGKTKCEFTSGANSSQSSPAVRVQPDGNCYFCVITTASIELRRRTGPTTASFVSDWTNTFTAGTLYDVEIDANGSALKVYVDGTLRIDTTDANLTGGKPGISQSSGSGTYARIEDFSCTDPTDSAQHPVLVFGIGAAVSGTGSVTPTIPSNVIADDILLLFIESANETISLTTANGFAQIPDSPQGTGTAAGTAATRLAIYWKRATGSDSNPVVADSGNHTIAQILAFRGCIGTGDPWEVTAGDVASSASTSVSIPGDTTTVNDCLILAAVANATDSATAQTSAFANSDLTEVGEIADSNTASGNGGGFGVAKGRKVTAGAYGATTATLATSSVQGRISIALKPPPALSRKSDFFFTMAGM